MRVQQATADEPMGCAASRGRVLKDLRNVVFVSVGLIVIATGTASLPATSACEPDCPAAIVDQPDPGWVECGVSLECLKF
jgi:hypothetical protein